MKVVILISVLASISAIIFLVHLLLKRDKFTRERFAFAALTALLAFASTMDASVVGKESPWITISNLSHSLLGEPQEPQEPRTTDHILLAVVMIIVANFIYKAYKDWQGVVSAEEHLRERPLTPLSLLLDGLSEAKLLLQRKTRDIYRPSTPLPSFGPLEIPSDFLEWHLQALDLIQLRNPSFRFNLDHSYHPEAHCWIGEHPQVRQTIAVFCSPQQPTDDEIRHFIDYVQRVKGRALAPHELTSIIAVRDCEICDTISCAGFAIQRYGEEALLDDLVDFSDYFDYLERRIKKDTLADSDKTLEAVYAPSACVFEGANEVHENVEAVLDAWLRESGQRQLALLGEYGQGKSTTALMFSYHLLASWRERNSPRVPILIELRGRSPRNTTPEGLVAEWAYRFSRIAPKAVMKLIIAGKAVVVLEGFDEMALAGDAQARYAHFRTLWGFSYSKSKVLFTGRPNYFLDDRELKSALNIERSVATGAYCESLRLEPFDIDQMTLALRSYPPSTSDSVIALAKANPKFREVASRGSLLYVIGELWDRPGGLGQHGSNINSATVIGTFIRSTYERQASKWREAATSSESVKKLADFMILNSSEREFFMKAIAYFMGQTRLPNQITSQQLRGVVKAFYEEFPEDVSARVAPASQEANMPLRERLRGAEQVLESIITDVRACGLLVADPSKPGSYKFAHKSFMEYLIAEVETGEPKEIRKFSDIVDPAPSVGVLLQSPEAMAFASEILVNQIRQSGQEESLRTQLRRKVLRRGLKVGIGYSLLDAATIVAVLRLPLNPNLLRLLLQRGLNRALFSELSRSSSLRPLESAPVMKAWVLYAACCAVAGVPSESSNPLETILVSIAFTWIEANLPHLVNGFQGSR